MKRKKSSGNATPRSRGASPRVAISSKQPTLVLPSAHASVVPTAASPDALSPGEEAQARALRERLQEHFSPKSDTDLSDLDLGLEFSTGLVEVARPYDDGSTEEPMPASPPPRPSPPRVVPAATGLDRALGLLETIGKAGQACG